jgi:hypothetical protein
MATLPNLLRSLLITGLFSFFAPVVLVASLLIFLMLAGLFPMFTDLSQFSIHGIARFLAIFGSGDTVKGVCVIGLVCSSVGVLFDTYTFYRYQKLS